MALYNALMPIGTKLRIHRKKHNLTQEQVGEICGVSKGMVSAWELNNSLPPLDRLALLHKKYPFSYDWLICEHSQAMESDSEVLEISHHLNEQKRQVWLFTGQALADSDSKTSNGN